MVKTLFFHIIYSCTGCPVQDGLRESRWQSPRRGGKSGSSPGEVCVPRATSTSPTAASCGHPRVQGGPGDRGRQSWWLLLLPRACRKQASGQGSANSVPDRALVRRRCLKPAWKARRKQLLLKTERRRVLDRGQSKDIAPAWASAWLDPETQCGWSLVMAGRAEGAEL